MSLTVGTHLCGGEIISSKFVFTNIDIDCCIDKKIECEKEDTQRGAHLKDVPCCENHFTTIDVVDDFLKSSSHKSDNIVSAVLVSTILNSKMFQKEFSKFFSEYSPPLLKKDIQTLFQVFII